MGVYSAELVEPVAAALLELGSDAAWIVHGEDGLDEITTTTTTRAARLVDGRVEAFTLDPTELGIARRDRCRARRGRRRRECRDHARHPCGRAGAAE